MRAQIKMFETIGVLVVFFFLLVTGIALYFGFQKGSIEEARVEAAELSGFQTALRVLYLPELDCSFLGAHKENCIDKLKLDSFRGLLQDDDVRVDFFGGFGFSNITVRQAWPCPNQLCSGVVLYENVPMKDGVPSYSHVSATLSPVLLFDAWRNEYDFGVVEVKSYVP